MAFARIVSRFVFALLWLGSSTTAFAQLDAVVVVGRVFDSSGAVVTDAPVEARRQTTNQVFRTTTTETGDYTLVNLPADTYDIQISKTGFQTAKRASVRLEIGRTQRFDFTLSPGEVATSVEIQAEAPLLRTDTSELGATINTAQIRELPNSFRDWLGFLALVPGAAPIRGSYNGSGQAAGGYNVGGFRRSDNVMRIDGGVMMTSFGFTTYYPSLDAIQEMDVKVGLYGAEYGQRPGGQVNAIIKSGTNMPHGSVFEFLRNDKLDARTFFAPTRPPFKRSLFGATVGAPILLPKLFNGKDKAWFFFSYAGERRRELRILTGQVPESAERAGRFAADIIDPQTGQPFPNRTIPANRINPIATKLLAFWPEPNTVGRGFNFTSPTSAVRFNANEVISKVDVNVSSHDRWSGRFIFSTNPVDNTNVFSAFSTVDPLRTWAPSIINTRTFGARAVNEFGVYMFRRPGINGSKYSVANYSSTLAFPNWPVNTFDRNGVPNTTVTGLSPIGDTSNGGPVITGYWEIRDGFSFTKGAHSIRAGFNWLRSWNYWALEDRSKLNFIPRYSRNAVADFLLGYPANTLRGGDFLRWNEGQNTTSLYVQDYWKASSKLTVNFGLRYEYRSPLKDKRGFSGNFDPATGKLTPYQDLQLKPWETGRFTPDVPLVSWSKRGFLPRVGLAYRLAPRTVVRAGYGVYSNEPVLGMLQVVGQNFRPHSEDVTYLADAVRPTISLSDPFNPASADGSTLPNAFGVLPHMPQAITHSWGLTVQRELGWGTLLEVGYQGSNSIHQPHMITLNDARPGTAPRQQRRPFPQYQNITFTDAQDRVNVQGLEIRLERRAGREGLSFQVAYAKLKSLDTAGGRAAVGGDPAFTSVNSSRDRERGPGQGDIPGRLVIAAGYELPFGKGKPYLSTAVAGKILGGWSLQTIFSWQAGPYISAIVPFDRLDQGSTNSDRPDVLRNPNLDSSQRTLQRWFDTSAFVTPPGTRYGNAGRGIVQGPGFTVADFAILRYFRITERARFELRGEAFNVTNKSNFGLPGTSFGTSTFGVISSSLPPRNIQLGLRFSF